MRRRSSCSRACLDSRSRGLYPSVVLALNTGMRSAELRWLQWKQIDLRAGSIRVGRSKTAADAPDRLIAKQFTECDHRGANQARDWDNEVELFVA